MDTCYYRISLLTKIVLVCLLVVITNILISVRWMLSNLNKDISNRTLLLQDGFYLLLLQQQPIPIRHNETNFTVAAINQTHQQLLNNNTIPSTEMRSARPSDAMIIFGNQENDMLLDQQRDIGNMGYRRQQGSIRNTKANKNNKRILPRQITPSSLLPNATFAACLLIKDDNDILSEWIAYHYHTMQMRNLIVAIDPLSSEQPDIILDDWSTHTDMTIVKWYDTDYMPTQFIQSKRPPDEYLIKDAASDDVIEISNHRYRQRIFLSSCMKHFRTERNSTWLMHLDTDEFIVPFDEQSQSVFVAKDSQQQQRTRRRNKMRALSHITLATQPGSTLHYIQKHLQSRTNQIRYPCIGMPRRLFGSTERPISMQLSEQAISTIGVDPNKFETLRWAYHVPLASVTASTTTIDGEIPNRNSSVASVSLKINGYPKVILDISAIPERYFVNPQNPVFSIHRPFMDFCPRSSDVYNTGSTGNQHQQQKPENFLAVNHYLGSWKRYSRKDDKRRSKLVYDYKNQQATTFNIYDNDIQPWLHGFINSISNETASYLLRNYLLKE